MSWKDLFSKGAAEYAEYRPSYPAELFAWLADLAPSRELAVDVGTGTGQAAVALAEYFTAVVGVEASSEQLSHARQDPRVSYLSATAEATGLADGSADVMMAAQAFHWFRQDLFFAEAERILRPGGILALVAYALSDINPEIDAVIDRLYESLDPYWEPERELIETGYRTVDVPFHELEVPPFTMHASWSLPQLLGYLSTWSAVRRARERDRRDPLAGITAELEAVWGTAPEHLVSWPLAVRAFRLS